ncbi:MAG: NAD(P)H-binding protein [Chitinophagaceae bacterium]
MKILFIGATGMLGKPVARELIRAGFDITLLARDINKTSSLFPGIKIVKGDVFDRASLLEATKGNDAVYCNLSIEQSSKEKDPQPEREGISNIIEAAQQTGIKRIAYLSSLVHKYEGMNGFHWWGFQLKEQAVQKIKGSGIPYTIFYPSTFMECYPFQMLQGKRLAMLGNSIAPMWFIAAEDYGKQVAASFHLLQQENREFNMQGHEPYTFAEGNRVFIDHYSKAKLKTMKAPIGLMRFLGNFVQKFNYAWHICEALNKYPEKFESDTSWKELGEPKIKLAEYAGSL